MNENPGPLEPYFQAIHRTALGEWMRSEIWRVPVVEFVHLIGIVLLFGSLIVVNLRLFGLVLRTQPVAQVARDIAGPQRMGLALMLLSGPVLFVTSAMKCYNTPSFWWKMGFLALAIAFQFTFHASVVRREDAGISRGLGLGVAVVSLGLWLSVLLNGMWLLLS
jgi:hypothetical protein